MLEPQEDSTSVDRLIRIYDEYSLYNPDSSRFYLDLASKKNSNNPYLEALIYLRKGKTLIARGEIDSSLLFLTPSKEYFEQKDNKLMLESIYYEFATLFYSQANYDEALKYNTKSVELLKDMSDQNTDEWKDDLARLYHFRSAILVESGFPDKAINYLNDGIDIVVSHRIKGPLYQVLAYIYINEEKLDSAEQVLVEAIELCDISQEPHACFSVHIEMGKLQRIQEDFEKATFHYEQGAFYAEKSGYAHYKMNTYQGRSNLEVAKGNYKLASEYFMKTNDLYEDHPELSVQADFYKYWGEVEKEIGNYQKASELLLKHFDLNDSLIIIENKEIVADLETKYQVAQKENELVTSQLEVEKNRSQRNLFLGIGMFSLLGGLFLYSRNRSIKNIAEQNELLQQQKIQQLEKEKKILSMNAMIEGQEAERTRIAKDLHDGLGGLLSTVKAHFSNIQSEIQKIEKINVYNKANELVDKACDEVRRISHNLMPGALRLEGLKSAIKHLGEEMNDAHPFTVKVETIGFGTRMEESKEVFVYRIIQEALNNIIKHANAKNVLIQLSETEAEYHFIVEDDGKGFDPLKIESGMGLRSIQSRVDFLKGSFDVDTREGVGTTLSWHMPKDPVSS